MFQRMTLTALIIWGAQSCLVRAEPVQAVLQYQSRQEIFQPQAAAGGMVASDHYLASAVGASILAQGGNAVDAAVATGFALAVVLPYAGNLGGGGFMLVHTQRNNETKAIDFREMAPSSATERMFLDPNGNPIKRRSIESTAAIGVPGTVAGLLLALDRFGSLSRQEVMAPAIDLARKGFDVSANLAHVLKTHDKHLFKSPPNRAIFFVKRAGADCQPVSCDFQDMRPLRAGELLVQKDLATSLQLISKKGRAGFYVGPTAKSIVDTVNQGLGSMSLVDLEGYKAIVREPIWASYRGIKIASMPPPSSGGVHLVQMLNMLSRWDLGANGWGSASNLHRIAEVAKLAYADRATYLGDSDFHPVPVQTLISQEYAQKRLTLMNSTHATPSSQIKAGKVHGYESTETTHYSVADKYGNLVSTTTTLNLNFGSGWMAHGTGILLNNEMDDFAAKPGASNAFGLIGSKANKIEPGKRPLSSMTPTLLFRNGKAWVATGSPGGSRIITIVLQVISNMIDFKMNLASALSMPRIHHQYLPDTLWMEQGFSPDTISLLQHMGHRVKASRAAGRVQSVAIEGSLQQGASDPRSIDGAAIGVKDD